ncbi:MAG: hypothetical protein EHM35_07185, partial [Planctomycetaceae bacterium]
MGGYRPKNRGNKSSSRTGVVISRRLRSAGWNVSSAERRFTSNGIFVSAQRDSVGIMIDLGLLTKNLRVANQIAAEV